MLMANAKYKVVFNQILILLKQWINLLNSFLYLTPKMVIPALFQQVR